MINLFRKIRQRLITENQVSRYLLYAIGEIVLVVIGILIALQINTWNEERKDRVLEKKLLENLVENLVQTEAYMEYRIRYINYFRGDGQYLIKVLDEQEPYHDSLAGIFHSALMNTSQFKLSTLGYEAIKNKGFEIVRNDSLKKEMMRFFEEIQPRFQVQLEWGDADRAEREKYIDEHFVQKNKSNDDNLYYIPFEPNQLMKDHYFIALINKTDIQREFFINMINKHREENQRILHLVKEVLYEMNPGS